MEERLNHALPATTRLLRVLVVDDNSDTTDSLSMLLRLWGHRVWSAYGGATAIKLAANVRPDVLLLDVAMPKVTGCEVVHRLRRHRRFDQTRFVAVSGYVDKAHQTMCRQAGFDDFLVKPLEIATLEALLISERDRLARAAKLSSDQPSPIGMHEQYTTDDCYPAGYGRPGQSRVAQHVGVASSS